MSGISADEKSKISSKERKSYELFGFDITMKTFQKGKVSMQRTTNGDDVEVQYYLPPYHKYYMISEKDCTKGITIHCLYHNNSLCLKWATRRNKRIGSFFIFKDDSTFYKGYWDGDDNHVSRIILDDCQHQAIAEVDMKRGGIQYRGGYDPSLRIRVGWGCEYDPVTGLPLQCGIYENNKIVKEWKVFHDSVMTEYASKNPSSVVYIGEYANDYLNKYPRHGKGKELDPSNGIVIWEGRWKWDRKLKDVTMVVNNLNERSRMVSSITSLILPAKTGEKERISILSFSSFYNLEMIDIGEGCFPHVRDFQCCGLPFLQSLHVGKNAFCQLVNGWPRVCKYKTCTIMNNPLLTQITFEPFAFADFYVFTLKDLDKLEKLVIGDCSEDSFNFVHCPNLSLRCLPSLQRVSLGRHSFQYQELTLFHRLPQLERIQLGGFALDGNPIVIESAFLSACASNRLILKRICSKSRNDEISLNCLPLKKLVQ